MVVQVFDLKKINPLLILLPIALAGTLFLSNKLNREGENAAGAFFSRGEMAKFYLYEGRVEPTTLKAHVGDEILFMVLDESRHNIAEERSSKRGARLESGEFGAGESYSLSFSAPGMYSFYDRMNRDIHVEIVIE